MKESSSLLWTSGVVVAVPCTREPRRMSGDFYFYFTEVLSGRGQRESQPLTLRILRSELANWYHTRLFYHLEYFHSPLSWKNWIKLQHEVGE